MTTIPTTSADHFASTTKATRAVTQSLSRSEPSNQHPSPTSACIIDSIKSDTSSVRINCVNPLYWFKNH
ncbi:hypothetical protein BC939DRAFT_440481 [Gamsiella multidivaricata]|uniref:uncharacterized protein n=1 Tax=Gamsiella multidivaricata TaxID=101098 RepID=UPI00221EF859|nr:uncharacterized protein BC939DRAFT_440481 [Gamsiella multidivaricata]KAI7829760.1 hypothetical protein BC939DRAFT_440481 [Gamsiella multidivaricata]